MAKKKEAEPMNEFEVRLRRTVQRDHGSAKDHLDTIGLRAISGGLDRYWSCQSRIDSKIEGDDGVTYTGIIKFIRTPEKRARVADDQINITNSVITAARSGNFKLKPWIHVNENDDPLAEYGSYNSEDPFSGEFVTWSDLKKYFKMNKNHLRDKHPCFSHIYGLDAQIRLALDSVEVAIDTEGSKCAHVVLYGKAGGAKTTLMRAIFEYVQGFIPKDQEVRACTSINTDSATAAGIQNSFMQRWSTVTGIPPIIGFEEAEKVPDTLWRCMLGALDDRQTMMKVTARRTSVTKTRMLGIATVNDFTVFSNFCGGAINSRFSNKLEVPRPSLPIMHKILMREIEANDWNEEYADAALAIAAELDTDDPREIIQFLNGRDRLLDGSYLNDIMEARRSVQEARDSYIREKDKQTDDFWDNFPKTYSVV